MKRDNIVRHHFSVIDSTNKWAKQNAESFNSKKLTLVTADEQSGGRGTFNKRWESPANCNIYATFCFFVPQYFQGITDYPQRVALGIIHFLETQQMKPRFKWPNDVLIAEKKISGILTETVSLPQGICVALGIGLNVNMTQDQLQNVNCPATSMYVETGKLFDRDDVLNELINLVSDLVHINP